MDARRAEAAEIMQEIVAKPLPRYVGVGYVNRTDVIRITTDMVNVIALDQMIVAMQNDARIAVRRRFHCCVSSRPTIHVDCRSISQLQLTVVMQPTMLDGVTTAFERRAIAAFAANGSTLLLKSLRRPAAYAADHDRC